MIPKCPPPIWALAPSRTTVSSGLTSRETSFQAREMGTASAIPGSWVNRPGSMGPSFPVIPMATRVGPGISLAVKPISRMRPLTPSTCSRVASDFITISMSSPSGAGGAGRSTAPPPVRRYRPLLAQLLVDDLLEGLVRVGAADLASVDEAGGGAVDVEGGRLLHVGLDLRLELVGVEGSLELGHVEAELLGVLLQAGPVEGGLVLEQLVVHLPELALLGGGHGGHGGRLGVLVHVERHVLPDHPQLVAVLLLELGDGRLDPLAEGALEVGVEDQGDRRVLGAARRGGAGVDLPDLGVLLGAGRLGGG